MSLTKEDLEKEKLSLEIRHLRKRFFEHPAFWLSVISAIVAVAGVFFQSQISDLKGQVVELRSERAQKRSDEAEAKRKFAETEMNSLQARKQAVEKELAEKRTLLANTQQQIDDLTTELAVLSKSATGQTQTDLKRLDSAAGQLDIEVRASRPIQPSSPSKDMTAAIAGLFAPTASARGAAYSDIMGAFSKDAELVPSLIEYAKTHSENLNGVYNTLVVLAHLEQLGSNVELVRTYANEVEVQGRPKIAERAKKLLLRLPKE